MATQLSDPAADAVASKEPNALPLTCGTRVNDGAAREGRARASDAVRRSGPLGGVASQRHCNQHRSAFKIAFLATSDLAGIESTLLIGG